MPYIKPEDRKDYDSACEFLITVLNSKGWSPGDVNYIFTKILHGWWKKDERYATICSIMGTLSCVGQEFFRKVAASYENLKEKENGEIK